MDIIYGKLLYCHGVAEGDVENKFSTLDYNNGTVYDCFNNNFTSDFCIPDMNIPPITIDDRSPPHKRARYTPDILPDAISVASENSVSTLTTPSDSPDILPTDGPNTLNFMLPFRLATAVALVMVIIYGKLLYCHGVSEGILTFIVMFLFSPLIFFAC